MKFLATPGSILSASTNIAMLHALQFVAAPDHVVTICDNIGNLPVFPPDLKYPASG
jgi:hypothetical protein